MQEVPYQAKEFVVQIYCCQKPELCWYDCNIVLDYWSNCIRHLQRAQPFVASEVEMHLKSSVTVAVSNLDLDKKTMELKYSHQQLW